MAGEASFPISDVVRDVTMTVRVSGYRGFRVRLWLGTLLIRLGARLAGFRDAEIGLRN